MDCPFSWKGWPMIPCRLFGSPILTVPHVTALVTAAVFGAATAWAQGQPAGAVPAFKLSEAERARQLQERDGYKQEANRLFQSGKLDETAAVLVKMLTVERRVLGELHEKVAGSLALLARVHELREDWAAARKALTEVLVIRERQPNQKDWRIADARRELADLDRRAAFDPAQRQRLQEADRLNRLQDALHSQGKFAEGIAPCRKAMEIRRELLGQNHPDYANSVNNLAVLYQNMGDYAKAELLHRDAAEVRKRTLGENHPDYATSLNNLAALYLAMGNYGQAEPLLRQALEIEKRVLGKNHPDYATGLNNLAVLYRDMGEYAKAEPLFREALEIGKTALGENHPNYASGLNNLAMLYQSMGEYTKAEPLLRQALEIIKRATGENHPNYASSLNNLAMLYQSMGDYAKAGRLYRHAMEIRKRVLGDHSPEYAASLNNLAELHREMGNYANAESLLRQAVQIKKRVLGENHPEYADSLDNLGRLYQLMGDFVKAEPLLRQALVIRRRALGENHPDYATSVSSLAKFYRALGDGAKAESLFLQALEIKKRALGENHSEYASSLNNLGMLYLADGDFAKAEPLCRQSLEIQKRVLGEDHPEYASSLNNLAAAYQSMRDYARAEPLFRQSLEIRKRALGENHPDYATSLNNLAVLYQDMGDFAKAEPLLRHAVEITRKALGKDHFEYANRLNNLGVLYQCQGQIAAAEQSLRQGLTLLNRWTQEGLATLGERQRIRLFVSQDAALSAYLSVAPAAGIKPEEIYGHVLAWKGGALARQDEDRLVRDQPDLRDTVGQLEQARARLAHLAFTTPSTAERQAWLRQLDALRDHKEDLERDLARKSAAFRQVRETRRLGAAEVAAALPPGIVLVDLLDYVHANPPEGGRGPLRGERRLAAFVLRRGQAPVLAPLGASQSIDDAVANWRQALADGKPEPMQTAARELSRRVWEPLKSHLEGATTVVVAPDGALVYFPLAALPGHRPGTYLVEDVAIGYISSAHRLVTTVAVLSESKPKRPDTELAGLLAIGGIDYEANPGGADPAESQPTPAVVVADAQRGVFGALAGTGLEVQSIGKLFGAAFPRQHALVLTGAEPTEATVKQQLRRHWRYLHLATHGFFESPARVAALRAGLKSDGFGLAGAAGSDESASLALAPLLHSGVALAGAARMTEGAGPGAPGSMDDRDDGILTAEEVQSLDLRGTDLVVLSACDTGLGEGYYGQGVQGLERAFEAAGARAVVASLWKVNDAATTVLMEQFYANLWSKKMPKLEALRQAQLTVLNNPGLVTAREEELAKRRGIDPKPEKLPQGGKVAAPNVRATRSDPALWAAFVLSGDVR